MGCIYIATCSVTGKKYVGKTTKSMTVRQQDHIRKSKENPKNPMHRAIAKYGISAFSWKIVHDDVDECNLNELEKELIRLENTFVPNGYNLTKGGDGVTGVRTPCSNERREKIRAALIGHKVSEESRKKMSDAVRAHLEKNGHKPRSKESYERGAEKRMGKPSWAKGKTFSKEHRENISKGNMRSHCKRGHEMNDENVQYVRNGLRYCKICANERRRERRRKKKHQETGK